MKPKNRYPIKTPWKIPEIWPANTCYIIGGGPSVVDQDLSPLKNKRTIGLNVAFKFYPWVDIVYFGDCSIYDGGNRARYCLRDDLLNYGGLKITGCSRAAIKGWPGIKYVYRGFPHGIRTNDRSKISWNLSTGGSAINIAYWLGCKRIVLIGYDMHGGNFHDIYGHLKNYNPYHEHLKPFKIIAADAKRLGIEILNTSPNSAIKEFPIIKLEDVL